MYHFDIPKTRQYDTGKIEVIARNSVGEAMARCELKVVARSDDYRGVLKNSPRRKYLPVFISDIYLSGSYAKLLQIWENTLYKTQKHAYFNTLTQILSPVFG